MSNEHIQAHVKKIIQFFGTQRKVAEVAQISQPSVAAWLSGDTKPGLPSLLRIEKASKGKLKAREIRPELF